MLKTKFLRSHFLLFNFKKLNSYFITSPIYYPNDKPHIGHLYTNCLCDVIARWNRLKGKNVIFSTGTDEHGIKIQKSAENLKMNYNKFVDISSNNFKILFDSSDISYSDFIRTTEERHIKAVQNVWTELMNKNYLRKDTYAGWYSLIDECFISNISELEDNLRHSVEWCEEENWIFDIERFKPQIRKWANSNTIHPHCFLPAVNDFLDGMNSISVSRPNHRIKWGVPVPNDPDQTIYVWFDALINYLTASQTDAGKVWPADIQVIGKDIVKFHTVFWPAILLALDHALPKKLIIHSHWLMDGTKMSKSLGNVVDPNKEAEILGGFEQLKYFLLTENAIASDKIYDRACAVEKINNNLVNITGNLLSRISGVRINPHQRLGVNVDLDESIFVGDEYNKLLSKLMILYPKFEIHMNNFDIHLAIETVISVLRQTNVFFDSQKPWKLSVDETVKEAVIYVSSESLRMSAILFQCIVPKLADRILNRLLVFPNKRTLAEMHFNQPCQRNFRSLQNCDKESILINRISKCDS